MDGPGKNATEKLPPPGARWVSWLWPALFLFLLLVPLGGAATYGYHRQKALIRERVLQSLELLAFYKRQALTAWTERTLSDAGAVLALPAFKAPVAVPGKAAGPKREALLRDLGEFARAKGFAAVRLVGADGAPLEGFFAGDPAFACSRPAPLSALSSGAPSLTPLHCEGAGPCHLDVVVPLPADGRPFSEAAAVLLSVNPRKALFFHAFIVSAPQGISGAEVSLVQRTGDRVEVWTPSRSEGHWPQSFEVPYSLQSPIWQSVRGMITRGKGASPSGTPGLYATDYEPATGWGIVAQIDDASAFESLATTSRLLFALLFLAVLLALLGLYAWWSRRHRLALTGVLSQLRSQKAKLETTVRKLFTAQETERRRVSYDIHDQIIQFLTGAQCQVEAHLNRLAAAGQEAPPTLLQAVKEITACAREARAIVHRMRPPELESLGLSGAIEAMALQPLPLSLHLDLAPPERFEDLPWATALALYGMVQEALTNVCKHAEATEAWITLRRDADEVFLEVRDSGKGYDPTDDTGRWHFGILMMAERIELVHGNFHLESAPGEGTTVSARVPVGSEG